MTTITVMMMARAMTWCYGIVEVQNRNKQNAMTSIYLCPLHLQQHHLAEANGSRRNVLVVRRFSRFIWILCCRFEHKTQHFLINIYHKPWSAIAAARITNGTSNKHKKRGEKSKTKYIQESLNKCTKTMRCETKSTHREKQKAKKRNSIL